MMDDLKNSILESIHKELENNDNIAIIQNTIYNLLKPYQYMIFLFLFLVLLTFILNVITIIYTSTIITCVKHSSGSISSS